MHMSLEKFRENYAEKRPPNGTVDDPVEIAPGLLAERLEVVGVHFKRRLTFRKSRFGDDVAFIGCTFSEGIDLSGAHFEARFLLLGGSFGNKDAPAAASALVLEFGRFAADVEISGCEIHGEILARGCRIAGDFRIASVAMLGAKDRAHLNLSHARIGGEFLLDNKASESTAERMTRWPVEAGPVRQFGENVRNEIVYISEPSETNDDRMESGDTDVPRHERKPTAPAVILAHARVDGDVRLMRTTCDGSIDATFANLGTFAVERSTIQEDLILSGAKIGDLDLLGLTLNGSLLMITGTSGQINIDSHFDAQGEQPIEHTTIRAVLCSGWDCTHWARFGIARLGLGSEAAHASGIRGMRLMNCRIAADLDFRRGVAAMRKLEALQPGLSVDDGVLLNCNPFLQVLDTDDPIVIAGCSIGGHLDLTNVQTENIIDLSDSKVTNSIRFLSWLSARKSRAGKDVTRKALILFGGMLCKEHVEDGYKECMKSTARRLDLTRVHAGSLDLTGLFLKEGDADDGSIFASHMTVTRDLQVAHRATDQDQEDYKKGLKVLRKLKKGEPLERLLQATFDFAVKQEIKKGVAPNQNPVTAYRDWADFRLAAAGAWIPRSLRLDNASIGYVWLSHESFNEDPEAPPDRSGIFFDDADVGALCIYQPEAQEVEPTLRPSGLSDRMIHFWQNGILPRPRSEPGKSPFPRPVSLRGVTVGSWRLDVRPGAKTGEPVEASESAPYLDLLDNDREYRASTYLSVEQTLRNRGYLRAAHEVFIASRYRSQRAHLEPGHAFCWERGQGRLRPRRSFPGLAWLLPRRRQFFRLERPRGETFESLVTLMGGIAAGCVGIVFVRWVNNSLQTYIDPPLVVLFAALAAAYLVVGLRRGVFRRFFDRAYWSLVDYGTSAGRLLGVILLLMAASMIVAAREVENFEPSPTAFLARHSSENEADPFPVPCRAGAEESEWKFGEALWMTLRYHVPLVAFGVMEKCVPKDETLHLKWPGELPEKLKWFEARDWFGMMAVLNYMLWPLFIPFLIRKFWREDRRG